jgi:hypothetical protein
LKALSSPGDDQPRKDKNKLKVSLAVSTLAISSILLVLKSGPGSWRYYLAGGICAAISHGITTPVDVIKVSSANLFPAVMNTSSMNLTIILLCY